MSTHTSSTRTLPETFLKLSADVSSFYGFKHARDVERALPYVDRIRKAHTFASVANMCVALEKPVLEPTLVYYATPFPSHVPETLPHNDAGEFGLFISGASESLGEILLIKVLVAILSERGNKVVRVRLNALGDRESQQRFARELSLFMRKNASLLTPEELAATGEQVITAFRCASLRNAELGADAPRSVNFLSEKSRAHFRNILEQLEALNLPYELDHTLVHDEREQRVLFAVDIEESDAAVYTSMGGRYDDFVRRMTGKKDSAAVSASIFFRRKGTDRSSFMIPQQLPSAKVYFVQLGARAKLHGLTVIDQLRAARIPTMQSFDANHLGEQLAAAQQAHVPYVLIMGQREVLDGTIIVRSSARNTQTIMPLAQLPRFLKTIRV